MKEDNFLLSIECISSDVTSQNTKPCDILTESSWVSSIFNLGDQVLLARNDWLGNLTVKRGQHVEIIDSDRLRWWAIRSKEDDTVGFVLSSLLENCPDGEIECGIVRETYEESFYLKFEKGDHLQITDTALQVNGWWYALNIRTHQEGYVHPFFMRTAAGLVGAIVFASYGLIVNAFDVVTDFLSGLVYLDGEQLPQSDSIDCAHYNSYSHPIWGYLSISLAWLPAFPVLCILLPSIFKNRRGLYSRFGSRTVLSSCWLVLVGLLWPISSFVMILGDLLHSTCALFSPGRRTKRFLEVINFGHLIGIFNTDMTCKCLEAFLEASLQIQLQLYAYSYGYNLAPIQMVSLFASFLSLIWNAMEWNWVGYELDQYIMMKIRKRLRLLPLYMIGSVYKSICLSVLVMYLKAYAIFPISILVFSLMATKYFFMKHMKRHRPMTRSFSRIGNILLVLTSTVSMALPRLPQHASYLREVETLYLRWEARITFIVYILTFACIMWIRDFGGLTTHECARISIDESFIVPLLVSIIAFGILYLVVLECYIKYCRDFKS